MLNRFKSLSMNLGHYFRRNAESACCDWLSMSGPFSRKFGLDRGAAIDRRFMDDFLTYYGDSIHGRVLEIGDDRYTYKYGKNLAATAILAGSDRSTRSKCYPNGDLADGLTLSNLGKYDCVIATNVLNFIFDCHSAVKGLAGLVEPENGSVLATAAGLFPVSRFDYERWGDYWRFNDMSVRRLFETYFERVQVRAYGNAPLAAAFIMGLSEQDVPGSLFERYDADYQILISVKASHPKVIAE